MPPQSPNKTIDTFTSNVDEHTRRFVALTDLVSGSSGADGLTELQLRRGLSVDYFFRVATDWQVFQDEWSVKAIAHKPTRLLKTQTERFEKDLNDSKAAKELKRFTDAVISIPSLGSTLPVARVRQIVDADGRNLEFPSCESWSKWARNNLADPHKSTLLRLLADDGNASLLDLVRQLRNFIAHRSTSSLAEIQQFAAKRPNGGAVGLIGDRNLPIVVERQNRIRDVGTYLDRRLSAPYFTPARFFAARLTELAQSLRWP